MICWFRGSSNWAVKMLKVNLSQSSVSCLITSAVPTSYEALVATLTATLTATRKKVIAFQGELVLQSVHNNVDIIRLQEWEAGAGIGQLSFTTLSFRTELQSPIGFDLTVHTARLSWHFCIGFFCFLLSVWQIKYFMLQWFGPQIRNIILFANAFTCLYSLLSWPQTPTGHNLQLYHPEHT